MKFTFRLRSRCDRSYRTWWICIHLVGQERDWQSDTAVEDWIRSASRCSWWFLQLMVGVGFFFPPSYLHSVCTLSMSSQLQLFLLLLILECWMGFSKNVLLLLGCITIMLDKWRYCTYHILSGCPPTQIHPRLIWVSIYYPRAAFPLAAEMAQ